MMRDILNLLHQRCSVRSFEDREVEQDKIERILKAAQVAPTACNKQPLKIIVIKKPLETLQKCKYSHFNERLAFIVCYDKNECWVREFD